jgi:hypothetical protein
VSFDPALTYKTGHLEKVRVGQRFAACEIHSNGPGEPVEDLLQSIGGHLLERGPLAERIQSPYLTEAAAQIAARRDK